MKCTLYGHGRFAWQVPATEDAGRMRLRLIRSGFRFLSAVAVCLAGPFPVFRSNRRIGRSSAPRLRETILIRGAALGIFPYWPGAEELAGHLQERGFAATIINHYEYARVADEVVRAARAGRLAGGLSLVGYSFGSDAAALLAGLLDARGVRVESMALIESTWGTPVPLNVECCINYYKSRALDFIPASRGVPVTTDGPHTQLWNVDVGSRSELADIAQHSHFTIGGNRRLHRLVGDFLAARSNRGMRSDRWLEPATSQMPSKIRRAA
jgi:pimeloyl-ACP methyl ester carboxylesterase